MSKEGDNAVDLGSEALASQGSGEDESSLPKIILTSIKLKSTVLGEDERASPPPFFSLK